MSTSTRTNVGDMMKNATGGALKAIAIGIGVLVYLVGIAYAEVHGFSILSKGVSPELLPFAILGMLALGMTAIALPLALHFWTFEPLHRYGAYLFYLVDAVILFANTIVDFGVNTHQQLAWWQQFYMTTIMPATPVIAGAGWSVLFLLDPSARSQIMRHQLRESIRKAKAQQVLEAANGENVSAAVNDAAREEVDGVLTELFGRKVISTYQSTTEAPKLEEKQPDGDNFQS